MNRKAEHDIFRELNFSNLAKEIGNIAKTCRYLETYRGAFYTWKQATAK
jgi:hypothetical protein